MMYAGFAGTKVTFNGRTNLRFRKVATLDREKGKLITRISANYTNRIIFKSFI